MAILEFSFIIRGGLRKWNLVKLKLACVGIITNYEKKDSKFKNVSSLEYVLKKEKLKDWSLESIEF